MNFLDGVTKELFVIGEIISLDPDDIHYSRNSTTPDIFGSDLFF